MSEEGTRPSSYSYFKGLVKIDRFKCFSSTQNEPTCRGIRVIYVCSPRVGRHSRWNSTRPSSAILIDSSALRVKCPDAAPTRPDDRCGVKGLLHRSKYLGIVEIIEEFRGSIANTLSYMNNVVIEAPSAPETMRNVFSLRSLFFFFPPQF